MAAPSPSPIAAHAALAADLPTEAIATLRRDVRAHYEDLLRLAARGDAIGIGWAEELCARLERLLDEAPALSAEHRASIVGAARYFVSAHDAAPDLEDEHGLDDDVAVFDHAARAIGREELVILTPAMLARPGGDSRSGPGRPSSDPRSDPGAGAEPSPSGGAPASDEPATAEPRSRRSGRAAPSQRGRRSR